MRTRRTITAAAAVALLALGLAGCKIGGENAADIGPAQVIPTAAGNVIGRIKIEVYHEPRAFEAHAELLYYDVDQWVVMDDKRYYKHNLPPKNKDEWMKPFLESYCVKGRWRIKAHIIAILSDGTHERREVTWPGGKGSFRIRRCN